MPAVNLISSVPAFKPQDTADSTPASFSDIPVLSKYQEKNVRATLNPPLEGFPFDSQGTLYILTSVLVFMPDTDSPGFQIEYPAITLHAISRSESGLSIYCQLDETLGNASCLIGDSNGQDEDEKGDAQMRELIIVPQHPDSVEKIFDALSQCASLHPDPEDEDEDGDAFVDESIFETFNGSEDQELSEVGRAALEHMESIIYDPHQLLSNVEVQVAEEGAFEDASEKLSTEQCISTEIKGAEDKKVDQA